MVHQLDIHHAQLSLIHIFILTGLSVGFANKTVLFNIGGPWQFVVGAYVAVLILSLIHI